MWDNIGGKLQGLAKFVCWFGIVAAVAFGLVCIINNQALTGIVYIVVGGLSAWIGSWAMYGLGGVVEYVENKGSAGNQSSSVFTSVSPKNDVFVSSDNCWICSKCRTSNPNSKVECRNCGAIRP